MGELLVQLVFSQVGFCEELLLEMQADNEVVNSELIGFLGLSDIPVLVGNKLMGKVLSMFAGKLEGKALGKELVGKLVGRLVGKLACKLVGKSVGKEVVGKFLGKERVGKRAPQLQLGLSLRLLLKIS